MEADQQEREQSRPSADSSLTGTQPAEKSVDDDTQTSEPPETLPGLLGPWRADILKRVEWDIYESPWYLPHGVRHGARVKTLECWKYEGETAACEGKNWRQKDLDSSTFDNTEINNGIDFDTRLQRWLTREAENEALKSEGAGELQGGLRLIVCDRPQGLSLGIGMSRHTFQQIEEVFKLHDTTIPSTFSNLASQSMHRSTDDDGVTRTHIVIKAMPGTASRSYLLSLTYNETTHWTDAFVCGFGMVFDTIFDESFLPREQLFSVVVSSGPPLWSHPLLLPTALLQVCARQTEKHLPNLHQRVHVTVHHLGVSLGPEAVEDQTNHDRPSEPMEIDVKWATGELYTLLPTILYEESVTAWQHGFVDWLSKATAHLGDDSIPAKERGRFAEIGSTIEFMASGIESMRKNLEYIRGMAQSQIDLLFSIVTQRDALVSRKANDLNLEIARATREDSISISTFTFITAIFLPPTFVATLFSMSMFDWSSENSTSGSGRDTLSKQFWVFWAVSVPLTVATIGGWYIWYTHADKKWQRRLDEANRREDKRTDAPDSANSESEWWVSDGQGSSLQRGSEQEHESEPAGQQLSQLSNGLRSRILTRARIRKRNSNLV